ncbi:MAG: alpha/beta hydrolase [Sulfurimonas sp.]|uniref:alpha/beta hydrolase n=1 Tax=Sulfurimonas sp. TaxID=2022749 RepID=UPI00262A093D|nr:alpha/beta hydrolase [Sulfurimonas sp.]MCW8895042.1 alpha/beta hydrolase [Sulfurimonas sp.]MCW8953626.1 alpha/beta hydrolase [Sulfurimonas sp.]MCW9067339.1 alpha/beta hydrolase [Sulfurimonas sp.]
MIYIIFLFFTFGVLAFAFYHWQHFMFFSPIYHRVDELDENFETLSIKTDDGIELEGVVYEPKSLDKKSSDKDSTLLFFGGRKHDSVGLIKKLSLSFSHTRIITFNYRSYGRSGGKISEKNMLNDGLKIARIIQKNYGDFYVLGFSIGTSVASFVASRVHVLGVFLVAPFDSAALLVKEKYKVHVPWLLRYKFDKRKSVKEIDAKTYIFASKSDSVTYVQNARNLKQHVKNLTLYKEFDELSHNDLLWDKEVVNIINGVLR